MKEVPIPTCPLFEYYAQEYVLFVQDRIVYGLRYRYDMKHIHSNMLPGTGYLVPGIRYRVYMIRYIVVAVAEQMIPPS